MTIKEQIIRLLNKSQYPMTNREIAKKLGRLEPSVRRATKKLDSEWRIIDNSFEQQRRWAIDPIYGG